MVPNLPGVTNNYFRQQGSVTLPFDKGTARIDHRLSSKDNIGGFFMRGETSTIAGADGGPGLPAPFTSLTIQDLKSTYYTLFWTRVLDAHAINEVRFKSTERLWVRRCPGLRQRREALRERWWACRTRPDRIRVATHHVHFELHVLCGTYLAGRGRDDSWIWTISETLTMVRGAHTFKAGFSFQKNNWAGGGSQAGNGAYGFSQLATAIPGDQSQATGNAFVSFLLGYADSVNVSTPRREVFMIKNLGTFFQDDWRLNSKLTLNLGLRYDYSFPFAWRRYCARCTARILQLQSDYAESGRGRNSRRHRIYRDSARTDRQ